METLKERLGPYLKLDGTDIISNLASPSGNAVNAFYLRREYRPCWAVRSLFWN